MKKNIQRILALTLVAVTVFGIASCDGHHFENQPEPPTVNIPTENPETENEGTESIETEDIGTESVETENLPIEETVEVSEVPDEESEIIEKVEYAPIGESYVELLYSRYFQFSYQLFSPSDIFYKETKVTINDIKSYSKKAFAFEIFHNRDCRFENTEIEYLYYYSADLLESRVKSLFGPEAEVGKESFAGGASIAFNYNSITGNYVGFHAMGGDMPDAFMNKLDSYEQDGEFLYIYDKIMFQPNGASWFWKKETSDEAFEQNCVTYKHTFKRNIDGSYYWVSSEPSDESGTKTVTEPTFTDSFAEELYDKYFTCRSTQNYLTENMYFTNKIQTIEDLSNEQKQAIVWFVGGEYNGFYSDNEGVIISKADFETKLKQYLGENATIEHGNFSAGGFDFTYDAENAQYIGVFSTAPITEPTARSMNKYGCFEIDGENLYIYDEYLYVVYRSLEPNSDGSYDVIYNNNSVDLFSIWFNTTNVSSSQGKHVDETFLNVCGYTYKHTFKQNSDGTYYWVSSEPTN